MICTPQEILRLSNDDLSDLVNSADASSIAALLDVLKVHLQDLTAVINPSAEKEFIAAVEILSCIPDEVATKSFIEAAISCAIFYFSMGKYPSVIPLMERAYEISVRLGETMLTRRCCNVLGTIYRHTLRWEEALERFDESLILAREMNDSTLECAARVNIAALLQDMGMYRDAIRMNDGTLAISFDGPGASALKLQCLANNVLGALRLNDLQAAWHYVALVEKLPFRYQDDPNSAASFEYQRALLLVREHQAGLAQQYIEHARDSWPVPITPRVEILLDIASGLCQVALGNAEAGLALLHDVYDRIKPMGSVHKDEALEALIEASEMLNDWRAALRYKKELQAFSSALALD